MKRRIRVYTVFCFLLIAGSSCKKAIQSAIDYGMNAPATEETIKYTIPAGQHYADQNGFQTVAYNELKFNVKFDSSAIYKAVDPANQEDINKLYGFSDNNANHEQFSARFGWNWARGALRLYAYVYNSGERSFVEITSIQIGSEYTCSIKVSGDHYIFNANNKTIEMGRGSQTSKGSGYRLYPYFGGDETAPHEIDIWIKELSQN